MKSRSCKHPLELPQAEGFDMNAFQSNNLIKTRVHRHGKHWFQIDCSLFDFHKLCISCKTALQKMKDCALLGQITKRRARQDALRRVIFPKRSRSGHPLRRCPEIKKRRPLGAAPKCQLQLLRLSRHQHSRTTRQVVRNAHLFETALLGIIACLAKVAFEQLDSQHTTRFQTS